MQAWDLGVALSIWSSEKIDLVVWGRFPAVLRKNESHSYQYTKSSIVLTFHFIFIFLFFCDSFSPGWWTVDNAIREKGKAYGKGKEKLWKRKTRRNIYLVQTPAHLPHFLARFRCFWSGRAISVFSERSFKNYLQQGEKGEHVRKWRYAVICERHLPPGGSLAIARHHEVGEVQG